MYSQGEILLIPFPFTDLSSQKKRPVLVLSKDGYNDVAEDIVVAAITSNVDNKPYSIKLASSDLSVGELKIKSCIRADKIYTLSQSIVIKSFGKVKSEVVSMVKEKLLNII